MWYPTHISQCKHLSSEEIICQNITLLKINHFLAFVTNTTKSQGKRLFLLKERAILHDVSNKRLCILVRNSRGVDKINIVLLAKCGGTAVAQWFRYCATNRKVAGSIPDGVIGIFHWHNTCDRTMALGSTQLLTKISWGFKAAGG